MIKENIFVAINHNDEIQWVKGSSSKTRYFRTDKYLKGAVEYHNKYHPEDIWKVRKCVIVEDNLQERDDESCDEIWEKAYAERDGKKMTIDEALIQLRIGPGINEDVSEEYNEAVDMAIEALIQLRDQTEWILISKEVPKENGYYLTTTMLGEVYCDYWREIAFDRTETVIAWMPLPKGYQEGKRGVI